MVKMCNLISRSESCLSSQHNPPGFSGRSLRNPLHLILWPLRACIFHLLLMRRPFLRFPTCSTCERCPISFFSVFTSNCNHVSASLEASYAASQLVRSLLLVYLDDQWGAHGHLPLLHRHPHSLHRRHAQYQPALLQDVWLPQMYHFAELDQVFVFSSDLRLEHQAGVETLCQLPNAHCATSS